MTAILFIAAPPYVRKRTVLYTTVRSRTIFLHVAILYQIINLCQCFKFGIIHSQTDLVSFDRQE